ncbi:MAG: carbon-nitrogen hydrolase family protein [Methanomassiliicoccaceae archaeon]|jgi:NAD+ synthase (glutamine-hydrolysing)|nr:carbon-nitrogen hydrolase family protein [Methanomassiliicoccaceae archaeon]
MRIAIAQVRGQMNDPPANASKAKMLLNNTDVDLLIFPEMFATGYDMECAKFMKNMDVMFNNKVNTNIINKKCLMLFGCPVEENGKLYNSAILTDGENRQIYKKIHLAPDDKFSEKKIFAAGSEPKIFECRGRRFGIAIGNDVMFGELFRWYASKGADAVICISAVPGDVLEKYEKVLPARCVDNSIEMIFVNMVGPDPGFVMAGGSRYISSEGNIIERCPDSSDVRIIKLDEQRTNRSKERREFLKDIRKDIDWSV